MSGPSAGQGAQDVLQGSGWPGATPPLFEALVERADEAIAVCDVDGCLVYVNAVARDAFAPVPGERGMGLVHPDDLDEVAAAVAWVRSVPGARARISTRLRHADGTWRDVESLAVNLLEVPEVRGVVYLIRDVSERVRARRELDRQLAGQRLLAELGLRSLRGADPAELARHALHGLRDVLGVDHVHLFDVLPDALRVRDAVGASEVAPGLHLPSAVVAESPAGLSLAQGGPVVVADLTREPRFPRPPLLAEIGVVSSLVVLLDAPPAPTGALAAHTTTARRFSDSDVALAQAVANVLAGAEAAARREQDARHRAMHDPLTGLANRALLEDRVSKALQRADRDGTRVTLLFVDLDDFKTINDTHGHAAGDVVLTVLAGRLQAHFRSADTVARLGGDEFVVLCADGPGESGCLPRRLAEVWEEPVPLPGGAPDAASVPARVSGTVGTATARPGERDAADLLARADADLYRRKRLRGT